MPKDGNVLIVEHHGRVGGNSTYKLPESLAEICTNVQKNTGEPPLRLYPIKTGGYCDRSIITECRSGVRDSR